jgi:hypothetical protein
MERVDFLLAGDKKRKDYPMFFFRREINALIEEVAPLLLWVFGCMIFISLFF